MISSFLNNIWKEGGLQGSSSADAYAFDIGLGTTMTSEDQLNGYMRVSDKVSVVDLAEFNEISGLSKEIKLEDVIGND